MPPPKLRLDSALQRLFAQPHEHGFYQALRLLERSLALHQGLSSDAAMQRLRFRNSLHMGFPASEMAALRALPAPGESTASTEATTLAGVEITPAFIGFTGATGTLPSFYTELIALREQQKDGAARAFLDLFLQRSAVQLYQAWRKSRLALRYEQDRRRHFTPMLLSIAGVGQEALRERLRAPEGGVADETLAFYAGRLQQRPVSRATLEQLLAHYFGVCVRVDEFVGRWFTLAPEQQTCVGLAGAGLNQGALVGARVWQRDQRLRITLGPLSRARLQRFLPGQPGALALREWLQLLVGLTLELEIRLTLRAEDVMPTQLHSRTAHEQQQGRLGYDNFLVTRPQIQDRSEPGYCLLAA
ncbi:type VI secretion system baseplate subunit TssG [Inhella sp. 1Y17]|uniref:Type VI secretion system baseplate subunit TssG n=1 Tax=Inhella proteolytica TaxID=2795029 RepID=A0A931NJP9_9BURK|nr:type VI secretion system baseplate subunit TssG [Inhella proteolytica]